MPHRATVSQRQQIGVETTPGTAVAANRALQSMSWMLSIKAENQQFKPKGYKYGTVTTPNAEWSEGSLSGQPTFDEIVYPLCSALRKPTPTTPVGATLAREWLYQPSTSSEDTIASFTVESGSGVRAHRFAYVIVPEFGITITRKSISLSGSLLGRQIEDGVTLTASPTSIPLIPVQPSQFDVYLADTAAGLDSADKLTLPLSTEWKIASRFGPIWGLNTDYTSWADHVELDPAGTAKLKLEADAEGMELLATMRAGSTTFMRIVATGPEIESGQDYLLQIDTALQVADVSEFGDEEGLEAIEWSFNWAHDATWGRACSVLVRNTRTGL